jgi:hypothetical protein
MKRDIEKWTIKKLVDDIKPILGFPEFQREPTVWDLYKKQKLIDSIFRGFDIAPIYVYKKDDNSYECIDGRQRINAIYSFLGLNENMERSDNHFAIKIDNDIYVDTDEFLLRLDNRQYSELKPEEKEIFDNYKLNVIIVRSDEDNVEENEQELSLQFIRLQFSSILNAGEKLHAMSGDMRNFIFSELFSETPDGKEEHPFFKAINIRYRRYAKEQVAAQIALNYFSRRAEPPTFSRSRYIDLQYFFKRKSVFKEEDKRLAEEIKTILDKIAENFNDKLSFIENRAIAVTTFLFVAQLVNNNEEKKLPKFGEFLVEFVATLKWQLSLYRRKMELIEQYRDILTGFQNYVTQAAGESYAIERRHKFIEKYFEHYLAHNEIIGDAKFKKTTGKSAKSERSSAIYKEMKLTEG